MRCFNKLFDDFCVAARAGQIPLPQTDTQRKIMGILVKQATDQGIDINGFAGRFEEIGQRAELINS